MTTPKKMGRPPSGDPRKRQVFSFLPPDLADWFMGLPPKERSAWLAEQVARARAGGTPSGTLPAAEPDKPA